MPLSTKDGQAPQQALPVGTLRFASAQLTVGVRPLNTALMTNDQVIALASSIGTCASALATLWTVREMGKQRSATYRPQLAVQRLNFRADSTNLSLLDEWRIDSPSNPAKDGRKVTLQILNIGLGAARDVSVMWSFHLAEAVARFNALAQEIGSDARMSIERGAVSLESSQLGQVFSIWKNQYEASLDFVLPASQPEFNEQLQIPHAFSLIISALVAISFSGEGRHAFPDLPTLDLCLSYSDMAGQRHHSRFSIQASIDMVSNTGKIFEGSLVAQRVA